MAARLAPGSHTGLPPHFSKDPSIAVLVALWYAINRSNITDYSIDGWTTEGHQWR